MSSNWYFIILIYTSVSKRMVMRHGGSIGVHSEGIGFGSIFYLELDGSISNSKVNGTKSHVLTEIPPIPSSSFSEAGMSSFITISDQKYLKALIVDDSDLNRKMMRNVVKKLFHEVDEVNMSLLYIMIRDSHSYDTSVDRLVMVSRRCLYWRKK